MRKGKDPAPDLVTKHWLMDPDLGGPKTCGSWSPTLVRLYGTWRVPSAAPGTSWAAWFPRPTQSWWRAPPPGSSSPEPSQRDNTVLLHSCSEFLFYMPVIQHNFHLRIPLIINALLVSTEVRMSGRAVLWIRSDPHRHPVHPDSDPYHFQPNVSVFLFKAWASYLWFSVLRAW